MSSSTQFYRNLVGIANIGVGATTVPTSNIQVTGNVYASNALVSPLILGTSLVGTHYGAIAGSNTVSASSITCTSLSAGAGTVSGSHSGSGASLTNLPLNQFSGLTAGGVAYGSATTTIATNSAGTSGQALLSGGAGAPTWGTLGLAYGGTGQTTAQAAMNTLAGAVTSAQYLRGNGTNVVMSAIQAADVPTLNQNTSGSSGSCTGNSATATTAVNQSGGTVSCTSVTSSGTIQTSYAQGGNGPNAGQAYFYNPTNSAGQNASCGVRLAGATAGAAYYSYDVNGVAGFSHGITGASQNLVFRAAWDFSSGTLYTMDRSGNFTATGDIIAYSDRRIKTDIKQIEGALDKVSQIGGYTFTATETGIHVFSSIKTRNIA